MPGSSQKGKQSISLWFNEINPNLVLDVGPGWGTYSKLLRKSFQTWHAIEIHLPYVERFGLTHLYDKIFIADIRNFSLTNHYDVIILGDVLEHLLEDEVQPVLERLLKAAEHLIISLPLDIDVGNMDMGTGHIDWNNPHELHVSRWSHKIFAKLVASIGGEIKKFERQPEIGMYLISADDDK